MGILSTTRLLDPYLSQNTSQQFINSPLRIVMISCHVYLISGANLIKITDNNRAPYNSGGCSSEDNALILMLIML